MNDERTQILILALFLLRSGPHGPSKAHGKNPQGGHATRKMSISLEIRGFAADDAPDLTATFSEWLQLTKNPPAPGTLVQTSSNVETALLL